MKLHWAGIKFKPTHCESFMDIKFSNGVLEFPCHRGSSKHVTAYATFMAWLLNTPADVRLLCDCKFTGRYFGTDEQIAHFFSNIGKDVVLDICRNYLSQVFQDVNAYSEDCHVRWAGYKNTNFSTQWSLISAVATFVLLVLVTVQSFFAVYAYYRPPS
ncbi:hypothetical protein NL676_016124 [Syzygium grande]|nr:hypothetical protein NL676_016124 [Syzygium grande]